MKKEILQDRAQDLRKKQAPAEIILWDRLRNRQLAGSKFRRQFIIAPYIVDFICIKKNLIIELDGGQHMDAKSYDQKRDSFIISKGFKILRYWNNEVFNELESVLEDVLRKLEK